MTKEEKLKEYILSRYHSLREFTQEVNMPYSTVTSIFRRGIDNSSVSNVVKICRKLGISVDALAHGEVIPMITNIESIIDDTTEIRDIISDTKEILNRRQNLTIDGDPVNKKDLDPIIQSMDIGVEMSKKKSKN